MRVPPLVIVAALVAAVGGSALPGCAQDGSPADRPRPFFSTAANGLAAPQGKGDLYLLQVFYLVERRGPGTEPVDLWRFLDETVLPPAVRSCLAANGLRVAIAGEMAREQLDRALAAHRNITVQRAGDVYAHQGYALDVPYGVARQDIALIYTRADGTVCGRDFTDAGCIVRFQCLAAEQANTTDVHMSQWIIHGQKQPRYRKTATGWVKGQERPTFWFGDLRATVPLREGQVLVVGPAPEQRLSIGDHLFVNRAEPYTVVTTIVLAPRLVAAGAVPPGTSVVGEQPAGREESPEPTDSGR